MNLLEKVQQIADHFMKDPKWVFLNKENIVKLSEKIKSTIPPIFPLPYIENTLKCIVVEFVASSINYCFWFGTSSTRLNGSSSTKMYKLVQESFSNFEPNESSFTKCIDILAGRLAYERFPLLEERTKHINELKNKALTFCNMIYNCYEIGSKCYGFENLINWMVIAFPGFASDMFLKRTILFFLQLYRRFGWFKDELYQVPPPADYQLPKILNYLGCITYHSYLSSLIEEDKLIQKTSRIENEIRAATVVVVRDLCHLTKWNVADIDTYLFLQKDEIQSKFHLCVTTDY